MIVVKLMIKNSKMSKMIGENGPEEFIRDVFKVINDVSYYSKFVENKINGGFTNMEKFKMYVGCKIIKSRAATYGQYRALKYGGLEYKSTVGNDSPGYIVVYPNPDGSEYMSWSPKDVFEMAYRPLDNCEINLIKGSENIGS